VTAHVARKNRHALRFVTAAAFGVAAFGVLRISPFYPTWLVLAMALGMGALALASPPSSALALAVAGSVPLVAADLVVGVTVMIVALVATQYLASGRATGFLLLALVAVALPIRAEWALVPLAGYLLGRGRGATTAASICLAVEIAGILTGAAAIGTLATGGGTALIQPATIGHATPSFGWLTESIAAADPDRTLAVIGETRQLVLLGLQPLLWATAAAVAGALRRTLSPLLSAAGAVTSLAVLAAGSLAFRIGLDAPTSGLLPTALISLAVTVAVIVIAELVFPVEALPETAASTPQAQSEEADVDDLLRVIASAEDTLASRHRTEAVVLLSDMKSFSALTEDLGSLESAKIVQRHRDLLLPVIERHGGKGKSTGGDGLVAAFTSPIDAVDAAVDMQRTLREFCRSDRTCGDLLIRIGIAEGEVVVDKGGRPFLGGALNLAARVMDLADGGRVMVTGGVAATLGDQATDRMHSHGEFKLKNIAEPLKVVEVLWNEDLAPQEIRAT
jgi:class 3 adenylate cyclase